MKTKEAIDKDYEKWKMTKKEIEKKDALLRAVHKIVSDQWEIMTIQWIDMARRIRKLEENNLALYRMIKELKQNK